MATPRILLYIVRRDIRLSDNPIFHEIASLFQQSNCSFTHLLPIYVFTANQIETSGLFSAQNGPGSGSYPPARSRVGGFWRCGHHRAKFLAQSVWDLKESLRHLKSDLDLRAGYPDQVIQQILDELSKPGTPESRSDSSSSETDARGKIVEVWMTEEMTSEEKADEAKIGQLLENNDIKFRLFKDEKYYIDDDDLPYSDKSELPDIFTTFRKSLEPLREKPRKALLAPKKLPPFPHSSVFTQAGMSMPTSKQKLVDALLKPLLESPDIREIPIQPADDDIESISGHPFEGGESHAKSRLQHLFVSGIMSAYKNTRNGLMGAEYSTKLSAYLSHGCITARQIHAAMVKFEDGDASTVSGFDEMTQALKEAPGYGSGENEGTTAVRFELLWRDYMRLCARKFGNKLFSRDGFRNLRDKKWESIDDNSGETEAKLQRLLCGRTGIGLIDASQRELYVTGYTGNRARQNVASFLAKHLYIDWRLGAEWYESMLVDYDAASNWGNWQYVAGVGNDPREGRIFNPIKQALDYDSKAEYIKTWVPKLRQVELEDGEGAIDQEKLMGVYQAWRLSDAEKKDLDLLDEDWVNSPLVKISFSVGRKPKTTSRGAVRGANHWNMRGRGNYRGNRGGGRGSFRGGNGGGVAGGRGRGFHGGYDNSFVSGSAANSTPATSG